MWCLVTTTNDVFAAKGWMRSGDYYIFQAPIPNSPRHQLVTPSAWVVEMLPLHKVLPARLPLELVHQIGLYV